MRWMPVGLGLVLVAVGVVWIFQGVGTLHGSFMTGQLFWMWMGVLAIAIGLPVGARGLRGSRSARSGGS